MSMALSIAQIVAASYNSVVAESRKPVNQWAESAFMRELERQGAIKTIPGGPQIEAPIDYRRNPGTAFLITDLDPMAMGKTDVVNTAIYDVAQLSIPVVWSKGDDAKNPEENQKVDFTKALLTNAMESHDDAIEQNIFGTVTNTFLGLQNLVDDAGNGVVIGGINPATDSFWRNVNTTFSSTGTDMIAKLTLVWNQAAKGSGSNQAPSLLVSDAQTNATFEGTQQPLQRYVDVNEFNVGTKVLAFKTARYVFSQYGTARVYGLNPKTFHIVFYKGANKQKGDTQEIDNGNGYRFFVYTMLQAIVRARSRCFIAKAV
jgi:hypothetical protein